MTLYKLKKKIEHIKEISSDDERAHGDEDELREEVLFHISQNCTDIKCKQLAKEVLKTNSINFARWCA